VAPARRSGGWLAGAAFDPARLYHEDRSLKNITEMDDDTRAAIASIEIDESKVDGVVVGHTTKIKLWDKNRALEMAMRHLRLYERDNA
jgi:phage terminase small subunit